MIIVIYFLLEFGMKYKSKKMIIKLPIKLSTCPSYIYFLLEFGMKYKSKKRKFDVVSQFAG